jgi:hypothetical protein
MSSFDLINVSGNNFGIYCFRPYIHYKTKDLGKGNATYMLNSSNQLVLDLQHDLHYARGLLPSFEPLRYFGTMEIYSTFIDRESRSEKTYTYILTFEGFKVVKAELKVDPEPIIFNGEIYCRKTMTARNL